MDHVSRREFATAVAALALTPVRVFAAAPDSGRELPRWREYADLTAIDFLASPGPFNTPNDLAAPLNAQMLENASRSGITAVNLTVDGDTVEQTFSSIAYWEREVDAHPDVLTHVRTLQDLRAAKHRSLQRNFDQRRRLDARRVLRQHDQIGKLAGFDRAFDVFRVRGVSAMQLPQRIASSTVIRWFAPQV